MALYSANMTFGNLKNNETAGDYIKNKTAKTTFCHTKKCSINKKIHSQNDLLLYNKSRYLQHFSHNNFNKTNLNINLITQLNLKNLPVLQENFSPFSIPASITPNNNNYIYDPSGDLFGNTPCGLNNYTHFMQFINN